MQKGNNTGAEEALKEGLEANPKSVVLNMVLADLYGKSKRLDDAITVVQRDRGT